MSPRAGCSVSWRQKPLQSEEGAGHRLERSQAPGRHSGGPGCPSSHLLSSRAASKRPPRWSPAVLMEPLCCPLCLQKGRKKETQDKKRRICFLKGPQTQPVAMGGVSTPAHSTQDARSWYNLPLGTQTTLFYPDRKSWVLGSPVDSPRTHFNICTGALDRIRVLKG